MAAVCALAVADASPAMAQFDTLLKALKEVTNSAAPAPSSNQPIEQEQETAEIPAAKLADEQWECDTGNPDGTIQRLTLTNLINSDGKVSGNYRNTVFSIVQNGENYDLGDAYSSEYGSVYINNGNYNFRMIGNSCKECGSFAPMNLEFVDGKRRLNEVLTKERQDAMNDENFDGWAISCGGLGYKLNPNKEANSDGAPAVEYAAPASDAIEN